MGRLVPKWPAITETSQMVNWRTYSQSFSPSFIKEQLTNRIYLKCTAHAQPKEGSQSLLDSRSRPWRMQAPWCHSFRFFEEKVGGMSN